MPKLKQIFRFDVWYDLVMEETYGKHSDIHLITCPRKTPEVEILAALKNSHVYQIPSAQDEVADRWKVTSSLLEELPNLVCVSVNGAGYDTVDIDACTQAGVLVVNQLGANAQSVAEAATGLMISVARRIAESDRRLRNDRGYPREDLMGFELFEKRLGIIGLGQIGRRLARMGSALGMEVVAYDPFLSNDDFAERGAKPVSLEQLLAEADVISLHCPKNTETTGFINAKAFAAMKAGAIFLNTARGGLHDENALYDAIQSGHLSGAGIDVWNVEPPPIDHPLLTLPNVVALYHTAGVTVEARARMGEWAAIQIIKLLNGEKPPRLLNPQAWNACQQRLASVF